LGGTLNTSANLVSVPQFGDSAIAEGTSHSFNVTGLSTLAFNPEEILSFGIGIGAFP
jgi:hypothetical protein